MPQSTRRHVALRTEVWEKATELRDALAEKSGRKVTIAETIERALECLEGAHERGVWLSPREAAPVLEQRNRDRMVSVLAQFIQRTMPERELQGITFDAATERLTVHLADYAPILLLAGGTEAVQSRVQR